MKNAADPVDVIASVRLEVDDRRGIGTGEFEPFELDADDRAILAD